MIPLRFGPPGRQLFAMAHRPAPGAAAGNTVLLCSPFGQEAVRSHRLLRLLAERLARQGCHVLRFDYYGTGDADGDDLDHTLHSGVQDVLLAAAEALRWSGGHRLSCFGLRLGGTLAALASAQISAQVAALGAQPLQCLALWDPIIDGPAYLQELAAAHAAEVKRLHGHQARRLPRTAAAVTDQALGFAMAPAWREQVAALQPSGLAGLRARQITLLHSPLAQPLEKWIQVLSAQGQAVSSLPVAAEIVWASDEAANTAIAPTEALAAAAQALVNPGPTAAAVPSAA